MSELAPGGDPPLLILQGLTKHYPITKGILRREVGKIRAVEDVDLSLRKGETLGLVGESGCGKSTLGRVALCLERPTAGKVIFKERDLGELSREELHRLRRNMQIIFQDPYSSLNPRQSVGRIIMEGLVIHEIGTARERRERAEYLMEVVGLLPEHIGRYPHEFSGGQRQRIGIARSLALQPELIICDEPLSALDVSIQAQIINLLQDLQEDYRLTYLFISHDLSVVRHISDRVAVMYLGSIVELADKNDLFLHPCHPYTRMLLEAVPVPEPGRRNKRRAIEEGYLSFSDAVGACAFHRRCPEVMPVCRADSPRLRQSTDRHWVKCHLAAGS